MNAIDFWSSFDTVGFQVMRLLVSVIWQSSILFLAVALLTFLLRRRRASIRQTLWVAALIAAPLLPLLAWAASRTGTPQAHIPVMPAYSAPRLLSDSPLDVEPLMPSDQGPGPIQYEAVPPTAVRASEEAIPFSPIDYPWALAFLVYVLGAGSLLVLVMLGRLRLAGWVREGEVVTDAQVLAKFEEARKRLGLKSDFVVVESKKVRAPMTVGTLHPVVLLPSGFTETLSDSELGTIAIHELAHIKSHDALLLSLVSLVRTLLFFHPLVWWACRQVSLLAEQAADDAVLDTTGEDVNYARLLTRLAKDLPNRALSTELAVGIVLSREAFLKRIEAILSERRKQVRRLSRLALIATVLGAVISLALAAALPLGEKTGNREEGTPSEWGAVIGGLRMKLSAPERNVSRRGRPLPLLLEVENVGTIPVPFKEWGYAGAQVIDQTGERLVVKAPIAIRPWEGRRDDALASGAGMKWTVWFDRLRFRKGLKVGSTIKLRFRLPWRTRTPTKAEGTPPLLQVFSNWVDITVEEKHPTVLQAGDLPGHWADSMDLVYVEGGVMMGSRAMHIAGDGRVTVVRSRYGTADPLLPPGRYETRLDRKHLDAVAKFLRGREIWKLATVKTEDPGIDEPEIRLSIASGGASLVRSFPMHVAKDGPTLMALQQEMQRLMGVVKDRAEREKAKEDNREDVAWGEAVEGVQCRLRADKLVWGAGEVPAFKADVRNRGNHVLRVWKDYMREWEVEVDGRWYVPGFDTTSRDVPLAPGGHQQDIQIRLERSHLNMPVWVGEEDRAPLELKPGKHTVRVAVKAGFGGDTYRPPIRAVSNPVEIEILPPPAPIWSVPLPGIEPDPQVEARLEFKKTEKEGKGTRYTWGIKRQGASRILHGWYSIENGQIKEHVGAGGSKEALSAPVRIGLLVRRTGARGQHLQLHMGKVDEVQGHHQGWGKISFTDWPVGANLRERVCEQPLDLMNDRYAKLWIGEFVRDHEVIKSVTYGVRVVTANDPADHFEPPPQWLAEGPFELGKRIPVKVVAGTPEHPKVIETEWIEFEKKEDRLQVWLGVNYWQLDDARCRINVSILDSRGRLLKSGQTGLVVLTQEEPEEHRLDLALAFGSWEQVSKASRFRVRAEVRALPWEELPEGLEFGPIVERTIYDYQRTGQNCYLDLDTGQLFSVPMRLRDTDQKKRWMLENGIDLRAGFAKSSRLASPDDVHPVLIGFELGVFRASSWDAPMTEFAQKAALLNQIDRIAMGEQQPAARLFKTREGAMGILQILGSTEDSKGVKIRYKLLGHVGDRNNAEQRDLGWDHFAGKYATARHPEMPAELREHIKDLYSPTPSARLRAATALGRMGERAGPAIPFLIVLLGDDTVIGGGYKGAMPGREAADALAGIGVPAVMPLIAALKDPNPITRRHATQSLTKLDVDAVDELIKALRDENPKVRGHAATALGDIKDRHAVGHLISVANDSDAFVRARVAFALSRIGDDQALEALLRALRDENVEVRRNAARAPQLIRSSRGVGALLIALRDEDAGVRHSAASELGAIKEPHVVEGLVDRLRDEKDHVRKVAAIALGKIGDPQAVEALIGSLADEDQGVRANSARALGEIGGHRAVTALLSCLRDEQAQVRMVAAEALGKIRDPSAINGLMELCRDDNCRVRASAVQALGEIGHPKATETLVAALTSSDPDDTDHIVRRRAARALGQVKSDLAVQTLIEALEDEIRPVRINALWALGEIADPKAIEALVNALDDRSPEIRRAAAAALAKMNDPRAYERFRATLRNRNKYANPRGKAARVLAMRSEPWVVEDLVAVLQDGSENSDLRYMVAHALSETKDARAVHSLIGVLTGEEADVRMGAAWALGILKNPQAVEPLIALLSDEDADVRREAAAALGRIGDARAVEGLIASLKDEHLSVRWSAAYGLAEIGDPRSIEPLIVSLKDEDSGVRGQALRGLREVSGKDFEQDSVKWQRWYERHQKDIQPAEEYAAILKGKPIKAAEASGSLILIRSGSGHFVVLGGGGERILYHASADTVPKKHQLLLHFDDDTFLSVNVQGWGSCQLWTPKELQGNKWYANRSLSPTDEGFTGEYFTSLFDKLEPGKTRSVKQFLITEPGVWGIGNGYLQDILFRARIHPRRKVATIRAGERRRLYDAVKKVVNAAISRGGRDTEQDLYGARGAYVPVLDRRAKGSPCPLCGTRIEKIQYLGGACYFCPRCQTR